MTIEINPITVTSFVISGAYRLDPITVIMRDIEPGRGELTVVHYGCAWQAYWGSTGTGTLREFLRGVDADYVAGCMIRGRHQFITNRKSKDREVEYLQSIVQAVLDVIGGQL